VAGATAGLEGILGARRAPAFAQATRIHLLQRVDFIPEGDVEVKRQVAEYSKQMKVEVAFETINANDLQALVLILGKSFLNESRRTPMPAAPS
jgi:hypothetical protein